MKAFLVIGAIILIFFKSHLIFADDTELYPQTFEDDEAAQGISLETPVLKPLTGDTKPTIVRDKPNTYRASSGKLFPFDGENAKTYHSNSTPTLIPLTGITKPIIYSKKAHAEKATGGKRYPVYK
jgi:hypothetical protein